jgi:hypothetical protein
VPSSAVVDGLVAWYRFEDSANTAIDYTAELDDDRFADTTAFDGTVNGASFDPNGGVRDVVSGQNPSGAYDLDGVDDFIETPTLPQSVSGAKPRTLMGWVIIDSFQSTFTHPLNYGFPANGEAFGFFLSGSGDLGFFGSSADFSTGATLSTGEPTHLAASYDGNKVRTFVNGSPTPTTAVTKTLDTSVNPLVIGARVEQTDRNVDGIIDDVRLYNRAPSASEINQIYQNTDPQ